MGPMGSVPWAACRGVEARCRDATVRHAAGWDGIVGVASPKQTDAREGRARARAPQSCVAPCQRPARKGNRLARPRAQRRAKGATAGRPVAPSAWWRPGGAQRMVAREGVALAGASWASKLWAPPPYLRAL